MSDAQLNELQGEVNALRSQLANLKTITYRDANPTERIILQGLSVEALSCADDNGHAALSGSVKAFAERLHISVSTVTDTLDKLQAAGVIHVAKDRTPTNWDTGEPVNRENRFNRTQSVKWVVDTTIFTPAVLADVLPAVLPESTRQARAKRDAAKNRTELHELRNLVKEIEGRACPHCGERHLGVVCGACGTRIDANELPLCDDKLLNAENIQRQTTSETFRSSQKQTVQDTKNSELVNVGDISQPTTSESLRVTSEEHGFTDGQANASKQPISESFPSQTIDDEMDIIDILTPSATIDTTPTQPHVEPPAGETLEGADTIRWLDGLGLGVAFALLTAHNANVAHPGKQPVKRDWPNIHETADDAVAWLKRGNNIGLLGGHADVVVIDLDSNATQFLQANPTLASLPRIWRDDAPDRVKILAFAADGETIESKKLEWGERSIEVLSHGRQAVIAGTHKDGARIQFTTGALACFTASQIDAICSKWMGPNTDTIEPPARATATRSPALSVNPTGDRLAHDVVERWCNNPANQREVDRLVAALPKRGGRNPYYLMPEDTDIPALMVNTDSKVARRTWTNWNIASGRGGQHFDDFELYCHLKRIDKRAEIRELIREYHLQHDALAVMA